MDTWRGEKPASGLQAAARDARYELLLEAAAADRIRDLCLAHQADDQAETFLMRLRAKSGEDGLAAMPSSVYRQGIKFDPLDEELCQHLMTCYQRSGRESDAVSVYERLRDDLQKFRARRPSAKTQSLADSILNSH